MKGITSLLIITILLSGCATGYHKQGFTGGFAETKIQDDIFKVEFRGNAYTGSGRAENFALLRCAEVAVENGYKYFVLIDQNSATQTSAYTTPVTAQTYGTSTGNLNTYNSGSGYSYGTYSGQTSGTTYYSGGQTYFQHKPSSRNTIKCFKEKPENIPTLVYDAEQVITNIKSQYGIK